MWYNQIDSDFYLPLIVSYLFNLSGKSCMSHNRKPRVLVVTAVYNAEDYISDCIKSVVSSITNDLFSIHHVIIDDGSTDNTRNILKTFISPIISLIFLDKNIGVSEARNIAIQQMEADYIFVLDADDVLLQNALRYLCMFMIQKKVEWVYGDFLRSDRSLTYSIAYDYYGWNFKSTNTVLISMYTGEHFFQQNCMYTKKLFISVGGYDKNIQMGEDFDLFTKFLLKNKMPHYIPSTLYFHRNHESNASKEYTMDNTLKMQEVLRHFQKHKLNLHKKLSSKEYSRIDDYMVSIDKDSIS